ncbi:MAG: hypothetical protein Q8P41_16420 [Pseudomonadota bacterium]|nr:hypothetical protein [Pseudomonadota bacterium]
MRSISPAWGVVVALVLAQIGLAEGVARRAGERSVTYVFTPMVDVVPGGVPLTAGEASDLAAQARNQVDARDIQKAYGRLGSTISLDDLLRGVEGLEASGALSDEQRERVRAVLTDAQADHAAVVAVQEEILALEAVVSTQVEALLAALPPETRARVEQRVGASAGPKRTPGGPPSGGNPSRGPAGGPPSGSPGGSSPGSASPGAPAAPPPGDAR